MNARAIPRSAVHTYLRLVRLPLDGAISLLPGNGTGAKPAAELALDRLDATLRAVLARILSDPVLREDAEQRREAAERARAWAAGFACEAERKAEQADARLEKRQRAGNPETRASDATCVSSPTGGGAHKGDRDERRAAKVESERLDASRRAAERGDEVLTTAQPRSAWRR